MTVFANGREISAEAQGCKVIAAFPDTCFTPPENPATPPGVPVPYPDFGFDSDLTSGSGTVKIGNKPISQENSSHYKKCSGDEAGAAAKKGIITSKNTGKVYAQAWSSDVKVESKGVARLGDMATSNHASNAGDTPPMVIVGKPGVGMASDADCLVGTYDEIHEKCNERKSKVTGKDGKVKEVAHEAHHVIPDRVWRTESRGQAERRVAGAPSYGDGINICLPQKKHRGSKKDHPDAAHPNLDSPLEQLGCKVDTPSNPAGVESVANIRHECFFALAKLVPKTISLGCLELIIEKVMEQTDGMEDKMGRTKKGQLNNGSPAQKLLDAQK